MEKSRRAGILVHPTSFPGSGGIGTLGHEAIDFLNFSCRAGFSLWQVLPLTPPAAGNSPYSSYSAFAGNPLLIDLHQLVHEGDLASSDIEEQLPNDRVDFELLVPWKDRLLHKAARTFFNAGHSPRLEEFWRFCDTTYWLHDYALFQALKRHYRNRPWHRWPTDLARRLPEALQRTALQLGPEIGAQKYQQWQFFKQWQRIKGMATERGISIIGDLPIFVAHDSADVWCNQHLFLLDEHGKPTEVAGVPPDYFSATGQLWGNPLYNWQVMAQDGYAWWVARLRAMSELFDLVRIDHFRGFDSAWHVPAASKTAISGAWKKGPGSDFFHVVQDVLGKLPFIAEDLGVITPEVEELRDRLELPGMKILQFAFDSDAGNPYLPHNHTPNSVVYTGTHDNDTTRGWLSGLSPETAARMRSYLGCAATDQTVLDLVRTAYMSVARYAIIPLQDVLELDSTARMNRPGIALGNWGWRFHKNQLDEQLAQQYAGLAKRYGRIQP